MKFLVAGPGFVDRRHFRNLIALGEKDIHGVLKRYKVKYNPESVSFSFYGITQKL